MVQGLLQVLMLNMSAHLTKKLGMAPGGEFRTAFHEVKFDHSKAVEIKIIRLTFCK